MTIYPLPRGQYGYSGHVVSLPRDVASFSPVYHVYHLNYISLLRGKKVMAIFRLDKVLFNMLCSGLLYYHANHTFINVNALEQLPEDGNLSQLTFITVDNPVTDTAAANTHASDDSYDAHLS